MVDLSRAWLLALFLAVGCDGDETGGGGSPFEPTKACTNIVTHCPTGYTWSAYATDEAGCRTLFNCTYNFYTGSCRQIVADGVTCLQGVTAPSGCSPCNTILMRAGTECEEPASCIQQ
jgi:hypothetical protein